MPKELKASFVDLPCTPKKIALLNRWEVGTNPGVVADGEGYLLAYRAEYTSFLNYLVKHVTLNRNKVIGLARLDQELNVIGTSSYLKDSAPGVKATKQSPNDPRMIKLGDNAYIFYNDRYYCEEEKTHVRQMYMCPVVGDHFGEAKRLVFADSTAFTNKGNKFRNIEKNWSPFIYNNEIHLIYLIDPLVVLRLDIESGECTFVSENESKKIWDVGIARGGTPCVKDGDHYLSLFHSPAKATCLGHAHANAYVMGAYWFSSEPPFEVVRSTKRPFNGKSFYTGLRKFIFPTALIDEGDSVLVFYGKDDKEMWALKITKNELRELGD